MVSNTVNLKEKMRNHAFGMPHNKKKYWNLSIPSSSEFPSAAIFQTDRQPKQARLHFWLSAA